MDAIHVRTQRGPSQPRTERVVLRHSPLFDSVYAQTKVPDWVQEVPLPVVIDSLRRKRERQPEAPQPELRLPLEEPRQRRGQRDDNEEPRSRVIIIDPEQDDSGSSGVTIIQM